MGLLTLLLLLTTPAQAKVLEDIPSHYVKVGVEEPAADAPGQMKRILAYLDGPVLRFRGTWTHPDDLEDVPVPRSPVPELVVPVRVAIPGAYKFIDLESKDSVLGEIPAETFTPEARVYRVYLPINAMKQRHRFEVVFHAGLRFPLVLTTNFEPPEGIVVRNAECMRQGVSLDEAVEGFERGTSNPSLLYVFCATEGEGVQTGVYAPMDRTWTRFGYNARRVFADRGLFFRLPLPARGVLVPETNTEFQLESRDGKKLKYELRFDPPYRPRLFTTSLFFGPGYHHYAESHRGLTVDEWTLNGKLSLQGKILPDAGLDAYADIYGTIEELDHTPTDQGRNSAPLPGLTYWAITARLGYVEPVTPQESEWSFMGGWWFWRLHIDKQNYGLVDRLGGPQFFMQYRHQRLRSRPWWVNLRWTWVTDAGFPDSWADHELGVGLGTDIAWVGRRRPLSLHFDFTRLNFFKDDRNMLLNSFLLYVSYPLY